MAPPSHAAEISSQEIAKCAVIAGDLSRLACFDRLAAANNLDGAQIDQPPVQGAGEWAVKTTVNPIDDSRTVTLSLKADSGQSTWGKPIYLVVRCLSNKTEMFIAWQDYLTDETTVVTRVGSEEAQRQYWSISTDNEATFYPGNTIAFLKKMMASDGFVAQTTPYNESPITATFDVRGMKTAIKPLREICKW